MIWAWIFWPKHAVREVYLLPAFQTPPGFLPDGEGVNFPEGSVVAEMVYPKAVHRGEQVDLVLTLLPQAGALAEQPLLNHNLLVEARLDLPLVTHAPEGGVLQVFTLEEPLRYYWQIENMNVSEGEGQLWIYLEIVDEDGQVYRQAMIAVPFVMKTRDLLGLSENRLVWIGGILSLAGFISVLYNIKYK